MAGWSASRAAGDDPDGRSTKLEAATAAGLLTLHPEGPTLHGNVVRPTGIEHVALPWAERDLLLVVATPVTAAVAARSLEPQIGVGEGHTLTGEVGDDLAVTPTTLRVARLAERRWGFVLAATGDALAVDLDADGMPVLDDGDTWPLELDTGMRPERRRALRGSAVDNFGRRQAEDGSRG